MKVEKTWPDDTFVEDKGQEHYCGSHWQPFFENGADGVLDRLPGILQDAVLRDTYSSFFTGPRDTPADWTRGFCLYWPNRHQGLVVPFRITADTNEFMNISPFAGSGAQAGIEIGKVHVWDGGAEAQIEGIWGESPVTFYDCHFLGNRAWYGTGERREFVLAGIAYDARAPEVNEVEMDPDSPFSIWAQTHAGQTKEQATRLNLEGSSMFFPLRAPDWDRDDYRFRGPVLDVTPFDDWLGQSGWKARVRVMEFENETAELDIFLTKRAWDSSEPPRVGQDIEGCLWLQGWLWSAG
ncbi:MAG: hypothetical protein F4206_14320 [Gammaproteobacteria bacterium]|nr:hypothetical protein [Gammaproteobacteria bacterium]MYG67882.1 hypothetical protein [Gammaproteobacteria bacterium]